MLPLGPHCSPPHRCTSPHLQHSHAQSKGCGHSGSHTCSTPHPQAGLAIATDPFCLPQDRRQDRVHRQGRPRQGQKLYEWRWGLDRAGPWILVNRLLYAFKQEGNLLSSFLGQVTRLSWMGLLIEGRGFSPACGQFPILLPPV